MRLKECGCGGKEEVRQHGVGVGRGRVSKCTRRPLVERMQCCSCVCVCVCVCVRVCMREECGGVVRNPIDSNQIRAFG